MALDESSRSAELDVMTSKYPELGHSSAPCAPRWTHGTQIDRSGRYPRTGCSPVRTAARLLSVGLHEGDLGQRAALHPLTEDGLRPRTARAVAAVELLDEKGEDAPALRRLNDDRGRRRQSPQAIITVAAALKRNLRTRVDVSNCGPLSRVVI